MLYEVITGSVGDEDGQFRVPLCVETDRDGNVFVSDMMRCRIQNSDNLYYVNCKIR